MTNAENQFYARLTDFVYEDELAEVGPPRLVGKPVSDADHVKAYQNILYPTKEAAIQSFFDEITRFSEGVSGPRSLVRAQPLAKRRDGLQGRDRGGRQRLVFQARRQAELRRNRAAQPRRGLRPLDRSQGDLRYGRCH